VYLREKEEHDRGRQRDGSGPGVFFLLLRASPARTCIMIKQATIETILKIVKAEEKGTKKMDARMLAQRTGCGRMEHLNIFPTHMHMPFSMR
jgi:hypothetical protein